MSTYNFDTLDDSFWTTKFVKNRLRSSLTQKQDDVHRKENMRFFFLFQLLTNQQRDTICRMLKVHKLNTKCKYLPRKVPFNVSTQ